MMDQVKKTAREITKPQENSSSSDSNSETEDEDDLIGPPVPKSS